ncbi:hypothetical protein PybrP1_008362 [[Pythium] brassicae (nom. inval.)]|nr:hypothetical protein PybrP1_008362 [[Pythium] brassicae (nom. inval.)]
MHKFSPEFGERGGGIRRPLKRWLTELLANFGLKNEDFVAGMSDGGSDVKWMLRNELGLEWEWCIAHMSDAASKNAFGLEPRSSTRNPEMTDLVSDIRLMICVMKDVKVIGWLESRAAARLQTASVSRAYSCDRAHLEKWEPQEQWFAAKLASGAGTSQQLAFPLASRHVELVKLLSLLTPVTVLNAKSQAEQPVQTQTSLTLYHLRMYHKSNTEQGMFFVPAELKPLVANARLRLAEAID